MESGYRFGYEVIRRDLPCHLYIDLDVDKVKYPNIHVSDVWATLEKYIDTVLTTEFGIQPFLYVLLYEMRKVAHLKISITYILVFFLYTDVFHLVVGIDDQLNTAVALRNGLLINKAPVVLWYGIDLVDAVCLMEQKNDVNHGQAHVST